MKPITPVRHPNRLVEYWKKEWKILLTVAISGFLFDGAMSLGPVLLGHLIDAVAAHSTAAEILRQAEIYLSVIIAIQALRALKRYTVRVFANRTCATMRLMIYNSILHADPQTLRGEKTGDLMNKAVADVDIATEGMRKVTTEFFDTGVLMAGYLIVLLHYDVRLTLYSCAMIPVAMALAEYLKSLVTKRSRQARAQSSLVAETTFEEASHMLLYRMSGLSGLGNETYASQLDELERRSIRAQVLETSMQPIYNAIAMIGAGVILVMGSRQVIAGAWTIGQFSAFLSIFAAFAVKASKAAKLFNSYQTAHVSWQRIQGYFEEYQPCAEAGAGQPVQQLQVRDLSFSWPGSDSLQVADFQLQAKAGQIIGITGPVACGKSSLAAALSGLENYQGSILIDGRQLRDFSDAERARTVTLMGHDSMLLSDTIENNVRLKETGDVMPAVRDAGLVQDLPAMDDGVHTSVGNAGIRLSGGQQERIALARILYHHSGILILDDPFASVDGKTEHEIFQHLRQDYHDCIILLISHRLDLFSQMDQVILMKDSSHFSCGTHQQLMTDEAVYRNLYTLQEAGGNEK